MKFSRRSLLSLFPLLPAKIVFTDINSLPLDNERQYIARILEKAFGNFKEHHVVTEFIEMQIQDQNISQKIASIENFKELEISEFECRIAESFIIATNYIELREGRQSRLRLRNSNFNQEQVNLLYKDPIFWTQS